MKHTGKPLLCCAVAAALLLAGCTKSDSASSGSAPGAASMAGSSSASASAQSTAWRTGLGVITSASAEGRAGQIDTVAAAVLLDAQGRIAAVTLDELEADISADAAGAVSMPEDLRTKRQKGDDYPLAAVSSLQKGWAEQADALGAYLVGLTPEQAAKLETDADGKAADADLLAGCTIAVDTYRDAVAKACAQAQALGAGQGDTLALGIEAVNASSGLTATDDADVTARLDITLVALTADEAGRVTGAVGDMAEPALTVAADGGVTAPESVKTKRELGDGYGMRKASALGKEWYEHSEGFCAYLKGKTAAQVAAIPDDGSDADLKALCTVSVTDLQKAACKALEAAQA